MKEAPSVFIHVFIHIFKISSLFSFFPLKPPPSSFSSSSSSLASSSFAVDPQGGKIYSDRNKTHHHALCEKAPQGCHRAVQNMPASRALICLKNLLFDFDFQDQQKLGTGAGLHSRPRTDKVHHNKVSHGVMAIYTNAVHMQRTQKYTKVL